MVDIRVEDLASVLVRFDNGARGCFSVGQVCGGHKNDLVLEVCGAKASLRWRQEHQNELWVGHRDSANEVAAEGSVAPRYRCAQIRSPARWSSGSVGRCLLQPDARDLRVHRGGPAIPSPSSDGRDVRGRLPRQSRRRCDPRKRRRRRCVDARMTRFDPTFMKVGILTAALQELTPREQRDARSRSGDGRLAGRLRESSAPATFNFRLRFIPRNQTFRLRRCSTRSRTHWTCDRRFDGARAHRVQAAMKTTGVGLSDLGVLRQSPSSRRGHAPEEARLPAAGVRCRCRFSA